MSAHRFKPTVPTNQITTSECIGDDCTFGYNPSFDAETVVEAAAMKEVDAGAGRGEVGAAAAVVKV